MSLYGSPLSCCGEVRVSVHVERIAVARCVPSGSGSGLSTEARVDRIYVVKNFTMLTLITKSSKCVPVGLLYSYKIECPIVAVRGRGPISCLHITVL